jgi:hypothetical protein
MSASLYARIPGFTPRDLVCVKGHDHGPVPVVGVAPGPGAGVRHYGTRPLPHVHCPDCPVLRAGRPETHRTYPSLDAANAGGHDMPCEA